MTQDAQLKIIHTTGSSKNNQPHAVECRYIHIVVKDHQSTVYYTAGVGEELPDHVLAACNGKSPWSTKAFVQTVRELKHQDDIITRIFIVKFPNKNPAEWTTQAVITLEEAKDAYMVEVFAESHCYKQ